jgi:mxaJ protein
MSFRSSVALASLILVACHREPVIPIVAGSAAMTVDRPNTAALNHTPPWQAAHQLRVCADPNNMPFSNDRGEGFENRIAEIVAQDIGATVAYTWWPQRRGFIRNTLKAGDCDIVMGVPTSYELVWATAPYYRSTYVFATQHDRHLQIASLDDPQLRRMKIGFHTMGDDYSNSPAEMALINRGIGAQGVGIPIYGDYSRPDPAADLLRAVQHGDIDVAIAWGPLAGYFAKTDGASLDLRPVTPQVDIPFLPFAFDISAGVRRGDTLTHAMLEREFIRRRPEIESLLREYRVPLVGPGGALLVARATP